MGMRELPEGWVECAIGDVSGQPQQKQPAAGVEFTYIDISSVDRETKAITNPQRLMGDKAPSRARQLVQTGDVLVSMTRPNLNAVTLVGPDHDGQIASTGFDVMRPVNTDPRWLFFAVRTNEFVESMTDLVQGALYPAVRPRDIRSYKFPLAPLAEQKRIADKLDALLARVDACRARLDAVPRLLRRFRQAVLAAATSGELTAEWRKDEEENWPKVTVASISDVGTGTTPHRANSLFYAPNGIPWITSAATGKPFVTAAQEFVTPAVLKSGRLKLYPVGTLLVAMYGEGKTRGQVSELSIQATINQACAAIVVDESKASRSFVKLALQANYLEMRDMAEGGNQPNLNIGKIKNFELPLPPLLEQAEIVRRVEALFAFADRLESRYRAARAQVDRLTPSLLAKAFRGELVPQDPNDEPASALLARIRAEREATLKPQVSRSRKTVR